MESLPTSLEVCGKSGAEAAGGERGYRRPWPRPRMQRRHPPLAHNALGPRSVVSHLAAFLPAIMYSLKYRSVTWGSTGEAFRPASSERRGVLKDGVAVIDSEWALLVAARSLAGA